MSGDRRGSKVVVLPGEAQASGVLGGGGHLYRFGASLASVCFLWFPDTM